MVIWFFVKVLLFFEYFIYIFFSCVLKICLYVFYKNELLGFSVVVIFVNLIVFF